MDKIPTIYFDESGNTGLNYLDPNQPNLLLASVIINLDQALSLKSKITSQGDELHFSQLKRSKKYRKQIIELLNDELINKKNIICYIVNKRFALYGQIVEWLIEPYYNDIGKNIYINGENLLIANYLYLFGNNFWDSELTNNFLNSFQNMMRIQTNESIEVFYNEVKNLIDLKVEGISYLKIIYKSKLFIKDYFQIPRKNSIDLFLSTFCLLCNSWSEKLDTKFNVVFDNSTQIDFWKEQIESLSNNRMDNTILKIRDLKMNYPLMINSLRLEDSKHNVCLQIADIIVSSMGFALKNLNDEKYGDFANSIIHSGLSQISCNLIEPFPQEEFEKFAKLNENT